jgi:membrane-associated phospholipid phosphatase
VTQRQPLALFAGAAAAIVIAHLLDPLVFRYVRVDGVYEEDWGRMLRVMGFVPLWLAAAIALALHDRTPIRLFFRARSGMILLGAGLSGLVAELLKLIIRRGRPGEFGEYVFRPFAERTFSTGGLGMPSSHALVAFGAAAILSRIFPRAWPVWWFLAWGCAFTRVMAGAHFFSDVVAAAVIGWAMGALVWRWRRDAREASPWDTPAVAASTRVH